MRFEQSQSRNAVTECAKSGWLGGFAEHAAELNRVQIVEN